MDSNHKASRKVSRRVVLGTAAGAGAVGAAGALGIASFAGNKDSQESANAAAITTDNEDTTSAAGLSSQDIGPQSAVLWLVDTKRDTVMIYNGMQSGVQVTDPKLAAEIRKAATKQ